MSIPACRHAAPALAIGGVGGSGTRLVAQLVRAAGIRIAGDLNASEDCLWFTLLFKRRDVVRDDDQRFTFACNTLAAGLCGGRPLQDDQGDFIASLCAHDRLQHDAGWLAERARTLSEAASAPAHGERCGWKEPNTHVVIDRLWQRWPELRYVHVVRRGVDVALGANQNQPALWGPLLLGDDGPVTAARSLAYWCRVQQRAQHLQRLHPSRMLWLDYDALCRQPLPQIERLLRFLRTPPDAQPTSALRLAALVRPRKADAASDDALLAEGVDARDLAYARHLAADAARREC